jgi:hypothetical protein
MSKITQREKILQAMEWDVPFHLTELEMKTGIEYGGVSKELTFLVKEGIVERLGNNSGTYIKFSKRGKIKHRLLEVVGKMKLKESYLLKLRQEYKDLAEEKADLERILAEMDEDSGV